MTGAMVRCPRPECRNPAYSGEVCASHELVERETAACWHPRIDVRRMRADEREVACHDCGTVFCVIPD